MEHSALHALELTGQIVALGGVLFVLALMRPAGRALGPDPCRDKLGRALAGSAARWVFRGALVGALATFLNLFVQVAEIEGKTVFRGMSLGTVASFATETRVGRLFLARMGMLMLVAGAARLSSARKWWLMGAASFGAIVLTGMVSHAAARPAGRFVVMAAQVAHITTVAVWMGILFHLFAGRACIQGATGQAGFGLVAEMVRRFSPVALTVTALLASSGSFLAVRLLGQTGALLTSAYGLTLIVKLLLLVPALIAGAINYRIICPALLAHAGFPNASAMEQNHSRAGSELLLRFGRMLELEVTAGLMVIAAAGILASVSPPGGGGAYCLTEPQARAMLSPHLPFTAIVDPANFYGASERTLDDLHYSEFTHNWSGVMVCLLGLAWLAQGMAGRVGKWAGRFWPFLLVPFAAFLAVATDPETWWLRRVGLVQILGDPQLFEHELGKLLLFGLVWLGWRDRRKPQTGRPLGYALPVIMIFGGFLLLGHAHSTLSATEQLTNLINVQHAVFGGLMVFAGVVRWLALRHLFPPRIASLLWPAFIIGLGLFMAFFYREVV